MKRYSNALKIRRSIEEHPENWEEDGFHLIHKPTDYQIWAANGLFFLHKPGNSDRHFSIIEKFILWRPVMNLFKKKGVEFKGD